MEVKLNVGWKSYDGMIDVIGEDSLCYQVRAVAKGQTGIRTISKKLLEEWIVALQSTPNATAEELRDQLAENPISTSLNTDTMAPC